VYVFGCFMQSASSWCHYFQSFILFTICHTDGSWCSDVEDAVLTKWNDIEIICFFRCIRFTDQPAGSTGHSTSSCCINYRLERARVLHDYLFSWAAILAKRCV